MMRRGEGDADVAMARLLGADRRFAEFSRVHKRCRQDVRMLGTEESTILRCLTCNATCEVDIPVELYADYLREVRGKRDVFLERANVARGSETPS